MPNASINLAFLETFAPASQQLLTSRALLRRTDTKYLVSREALPEILEGLTEHYALLRTNGRPCAAYRTRYFDTPEHVSYHDHRRGRRVRYKVRCRHYLDRDKSYLEVKRRGRGGTDKVRTRHPFLDETLSQEDRLFVQEATGQGAERLEPGLGNAFERIMLVGLDRAERATIDLDLQFESAGRQASLHQVVIVEVKQEKICNRSPLRVALRRCGFRPSAASKFCLGTLALDPAERPGRLVPIVRRVSALEGPGVPPHWLRGVGAASSSLGRPGAAAY